MIQLQSSALCRCGLLAAVWLAAHTTVQAQPYPPAEALKRMKPAAGFRVSLVAHEPMVRQPVTITFDDRGRLWVLQYLQYPNPAGLKPVKVDQYLRTIYDRVPEPPPKGPKGADRITILEAPDENGVYRKARDFVVGLNLASGMAIGHGGVFVVQPPYLLFYPDRNGDDIPDSDPEVLLSGFGMEDSHAFANSLQWGPDGWLYGAHGSTVTANIRGIEFQQGIWRYHPITREFELFAEGGGNTWGLDFDAFGNIIAGTNWGGFACLYMVQGGYYIKGWAKHGPLHNPFAFGFFDHIPYTGFRGGHVTCGGIIYQGGAFPDYLNHQYIAANLLSNAIHWHKLEKHGSSFKARHGGELLTTDDLSFRPIDCLTGPDGALYIADWCDRRANHVDPVDNWDRSNGRVWKLEYIGGGIQGSGVGRRDIAPKGGIQGPGKQLHLSELSSKELVDLLSHRNCWYRREVRRILAERRDASIVPLLWKMVDENVGELALESLWAWYVSGGKLDDDNIARLLRHSHEGVRTWTVRLIGDTSRVSPAVREHLVALARSWDGVEFCCQLACTAKRLPAADALPIISQLLTRSEYASDPQLGMLLWWAIESKAVSDRQGVMALFAQPALLQHRLVEEYITERLARRYLAAGSDADHAACALLLQRAPRPADVDRLIAGMEKALEGRGLPCVPEPLAPAIAGVWRDRSDSPIVLRLALRLNHPEALARARQRIVDPKTPLTDQLAFIETLGQLGKPDTVPLFIDLLRNSSNAKVRQASLAALQASPDPKVASQVLELYPKLPPDLRARAQTLLVSREPSALEFLKLVDAGKIDKKEVPLDQLQRMVRYKDEQIHKLLEKHWGKVGPQSSGEKQSRMRSLELIVRRGKGDAGRGKLLFQKHCAVCHVLFNEGNKVGPELTGVDRKNLTFLVHSIVDPSAFIRPEYVAYHVGTRDGRVLTGLLVEDTPKSVTLLDAKNERNVIARDTIEELLPAKQSLMPEKLLDTLTDQEICDLFAYLQQNESGAQGADAPRSGPDAPPSAEKLLTVLLISGSLEYKSDESLATFQTYLEKNYHVKCLRAFRKTDTDIPGLDQLDKCDVALFYTRRLQIDGEQLERIKKYCQAGKPIVALRTASHGFQKWLDMDKLVLGGSYSNHYKEGPLCEVKITDKGKVHPILQGVGEFKSVASLYKNPKNAPDCEILLTGSIPGTTEPLAWTRIHHGGRVFYTSLGHLQDFQDENFRRMVAQALFWTANRTPAKR